MQLSEIHGTVRINFPLQSSENLYSFRMNSGRNKSYLFDQLYSIFVVILGARIPKGRVWGLV